MKTTIKSVMTTFLLAMSVVFTGSVFAGGHSHGDSLKLGEHTSKSWKVEAIQFGKVTASTKELVFTLKVRANGGKLTDVQAVRLWMGDIDSDSVVNKIQSRSIEDMLYLHGHVSIAEGDDHSQFTLELDDGSDDGETITIKTK